MKQRIAELEKEKEKRKLTEAKLNLVLKRQLKTSHRARTALAGLLAAVAGFATLATVTGINLYLLYRTTNINTPRLSQLDRSLAEIKVGRLLKQTFVAVPFIKALVASRLQYSGLKLFEMNRLQGHANTITKIRFSPSGELIASISEDRTVKVWKINGRLLATLPGQRGSIADVSFSLK